MKFELFSIEKEDWPGGSLAICQFNEDHSLFYAFLSDINLTIELLWAFQFEIRKYDDGIQLEVWVLDKLVFSKDFLRPPNGGAGSLIAG